MRIIIAEHSGFCFGVKRALDMATKAKGKSVKTLGPLIHNPQVIEELDKQGIKTAESIDDVGDTVIIRAHGVSDDVLNNLDKKGSNIVNAICPFVQKVHNLAKKLESQGYKIIIIGESEHPEVKGIAGNLKDPIIISDPSDVDNIPNSDMIGVVSQTTQSHKNFDEIVKRLMKKTDDLIIRNTICHSTTSRQDAVIKLSKIVDLMIIVGGKNSGNTKRLKQLAEENVDTKQIETADELNKEWFIGKETVGISAGASTPDWIIGKVKDKIKWISENK